MSLMEFLEEFGEILSWQLLIFIIVVLFIIYKIVSNVIIEFNLWRKRRKPFKFKGQRRSIQEASTLLKEYENRLQNDIKAKQERNDEF